MNGLTDNAALMQDSTQELDPDVESSGLSYSSETGR